jgi:hypothetical protein
VDKEYGLRWREADRSGHLVTREKFFRTDEARSKFADLVAESSRFICFVAWCESLGRNVTIPASEV